MYHIPQFPTNPQHISTKLQGHILHGFDFFAINVHDAGSFCSHDFIAVPYIPYHAPGFRVIGSYDVRV